MDKLEKIEEYINEAGNYKLSDFPKAHNQMMVRFQMGYIAGLQEAKRNIEIILKGE